MDFPIDLAQIPIEEVQVLGCIVNATTLMRKLALVVQETSYGSLATTAIVVSLPNCMVVHVANLINFSSVT